MASGAPKSAVTWDGDELVLAPGYRPWPTWVGFATAVVLWFMAGAADIHEAFILCLPLAVGVAVLSGIVMVSQPRASVGIRAGPSGLVSDSGTVLWSSCEGLELVLPGDGSGRIALRHPRLTLVAWSRGADASEDAMRAVAEAISALSGLSVEERSSPLEGEGGRAELRREVDLDEVRFFVSGGLLKPFGATTSYGERDPIIADREGLRVGSKRARWAHIQSIELDVRPDTVVVGNQSGQVIAGFITVRTGFETWVILRRSVAETSSTPPSSIRRLGDQRELEALVSELRQLRAKALAPELGGDEDVPEELAQMLTKRRSADQGVSR